MATIVFLILLVIIFLVVYAHRSRLGERRFEILCFVIVALALLAFVRIIDVTSIRLTDLWPKR